MQKSHRTVFKISELNEKRTKLTNTAKTLFATPGDSELKTAFTHAVNDFIDSILTYTEDLLAQLDRDISAAMRPKPFSSSCSPGVDSSTEDWGGGGEQSEMDYTFLAADNEILNDELASRDEMIQRLTEHIGALERSNKERIQDVHRLTQDNLLLLEQKIDALGQEEEGNKVCELLRAEAAIVAQNNKELLKTIEAMKAEEARLERLLAAQEEQRTALEEQCDRVYSATQKLCFEQQHVQGDEHNSNSNTLSRRKSRRQRKVMSMCADDVVSESTRMGSPSAIVNVSLSRRGNDGCDSSTKRLVALLGSVVPGFESEWGKLSKEKISVVDRAVRSLAKSGGNDNVVSSQRAIRDIPEAIWDWERAGYVSELQRKLAYRKITLSTREAARRNELVNIASELGARIAKLVGALSLVLSSQCANPAGAGSSYESQSLGSRRRKTMSDARDIGDASTAVLDPKNVYFAREEIDSDFTIIRGVISDLISHVREYTKDSDSNDSGGGNSDNNDVTDEKAAKRASAPKLGRVYDQLENEIRCVCVKGTADSAVVAVAARSWEGRMGACAQLARGLERDGTSATACASRIFAIVSAGYRCFKNFASDPYRFMLWELSTTALRLARVLFRVSNCYETARQIAATPAPQKASANTPDTGLWDELLSERRGSEDDDSGVTLNRLVEAMTPVNPIRHKHDVGVVCGALGMLRRYTHPGVLLGKLIERYNVPGSALSAKHRDQVQQNVLCVLRTWATSFAAVDDLDAVGAVQVLLRFLEGLPQETAVPAALTHPATAAVANVQQLRREVRHALSQHNRYDRAQAAPHARIPIFREINSPLELITMSNPIIVAEQLTLATHAKMAVIRASDLSYLITTNIANNTNSNNNINISDMEDKMRDKSTGKKEERDKVKRNVAMMMEEGMDVCNGISGMIERLEQVRQLVGIATLVGGSADQRAMMLNRLAKMMVRLHELRNFNDLMCVYMGFKSACVGQLERTMRAVSPETTAALSRFDRLFSEEKCREYRKEVERAVGDGKPFIPALEVVRRDLVALGDRMGGAVSVDCCEEFWECVAPVVKCQSRQYTIVVVEPLCSAVDELPTCTDAALFSLSSAYEPRKHVGYLGKK